MTELFADQSHARDATVDVILRDGSTLRLRAPEDSDATILSTFFHDLSDRSRYLRFHGLAVTDSRFVRTLLAPDWGQRGCLVAIAAGSDGETIAGVANYVRLRDPLVAEVAFVVADQFQGRGIGTRMLEQLAEMASEHGIESFLAEVLPDNRAMLSVFEDVGFRATRTLESGVVEVRFPIAPTEHYRASVDERDHVAVRESLRPFFEPKTVAVIGASARRGSIGGELFRNITTGGFTGAAYPVNRSGEPIAGVRAYTSIEDIPDTVDLCVICLPGAQVIDAAAAALRRGTRALCVISAGFAETDDEGKERQRRLLDMVREHGARLVGPNCLGIASASVGMNATFAPRAFSPGRIGFSSQSGALGLALLERAEERGIGVSSFVSIGNKADVSSNDLLEWWQDDPDTDVVLMYLESFGNPRKFSRIARRLAGEKPILAMKSGRSKAGRKAAGSHTAALAGSDTAVDAVFRQAGVIRANTLVELLDVAALLSSQPLPKGRRVAVVTNAGGLGILCADACEAAGLELPPLSDETRAAIAALVPNEASTSNPVDMLGSATADHYRAVLPAVLADPGIDAVIVLFVPPVAVSTTSVGAAISDAVAASGTAKTVLAAILAADGAPSTLRQSSPVPGFSYPESAARALGRAAERAEWLRRPAGAVVSFPDIDHETARALVHEALADTESRWLEPAEARALLVAYGIPVAAERSAGTADEAVEMAEALGYPVVVKTAAAGAHKTETGGVALDLADPEDVRAAVNRIGAPVILQPMVRSRVELLAGIVQDPVFGPLVAFGPGGVFAELIGDPQFRLAPLTDIDANELVHDGKAGRLISGYRNAPPAEAGALEELLQRLGQLAHDLPEVAELDLNPILGLADGALAVDARVRVARPLLRHDVKTW